MTKILVISIFFLGTALVLIPAASAIGALVGWIISLTFLGDWILAALRSIGVDHIDLTDFGALLGFAGSFLRTRVEANQ